MNYSGQISPKFRKRFTRLPERIQIAALESFQLWLEDKQYPSLQFKNIRGKKRDDVYSMRVTKTYRMLGKLQEEDFIIWYWVGPHTEYDRLIRNL